MQLVIHSFFVRINKYTSREDVIYSWFITFQARFIDVGRPLALLLAFIFSPAVVGVPCNACLGRRGVDDHPAGNAKVVRRDVVGVEPFQFTGVL